MKNETKNENSVRIQTSFLNAVEKKALIWLANKQPKWANADLFTFIGFIGAVIVAIGFIFSNYSVHFLWLTIAGLVVNWYGDSLDGTLARVRNQQRPIYGFYVDHTVDAINEALMFLGAGMSPFMHFELACVILVVYLMLTLNVAMNAHLKGEFCLTYSKLGPTEFRLIIVLVCILLIFIRPLRDFMIEIPWVVRTMSIRALDIVGLVILFALVVIYFVTIRQDARYYDKIDPKHKNE